jgi:hypothetical protein
MHREPYHQRWDQEVAEVEAPVPIRMANQVVDVPEHVLVDAQDIRVLL